MKFFAEYCSSCCRPAFSSPPQQEVERATTTTTTAAAQRRKLTGSKSGSAAHWRPGLSAISEDAVLPLMTSDITHKKASGNKRRSMAKSKSFNCGDEHSSRKSSIPLIIPVFSPTPFMF